MPASATPSGVQLKPRSPGSLLKRNIRTGPPANRGVIVCLVVSVQMLRVWQVPLHRARRRRARKIRKFPRDVLRFAAAVRSLRASPGSLRSLQHGGVAAQLRTCVRIRRMKAFESQPAKQQAKFVQYLQRQATAAPKGAGEREGALLVAPPALNRDDGCVEIAGAQ